MIGRLSRMIEAAAAAAGVTPDDLRGPSRRRPLPDIRCAIVLAGRHKGMTQREIGEALNRTIAGVRHAERRAA